MDKESTRLHLAGEVSSAGRALPPLDGQILSAVRSQGPFLWDENGRRYIDTLMSFGATILGHAPPEVVGAVTRAIAEGPMHGTPNILEEVAAAALTRHTGRLSRAIFLNSGSEAVHFACRVARRIKGRPLIARFAGSYHGWHDGYTFGNAGTPEADMKGPERPVSDRFALLRYNNEEDLEKLFKERKDIAAILIEPILANAGCILPASGYLERLQKAARENDALIILDEVLVGFRLHNGLAADILGLAPDLAAVGKAIGSGFAVSAVIGTEEVMAVVRDGSVAPAGTYNGNAVACAAVASTAKLLEELDYSAMMRRGERLRRSIEDSAKRVGLPLATSGHGSVFTIWFAETSPATYAEALSLQRADLTSKFHLALRRRGILTMPNPLGRWFISGAHDDEVIEALMCAASAALKEL
jgi:glutamate-1-semialdehyde 2,1-aminomutase